MTFGVQCNLSPTCGIVFQSEPSHLENGPILSNKGTRGQSGQVSILYRSPHLTSGIRTIETLQKQSARAFQFRFKTRSSNVPNTRTEQSVIGAKGNHMRFQDVSLMLKPKSRARMRAETASFRD